MRVVLDIPGSPSADVELVISDPEATVTDLLDALDAGSQPGVVIDGRFFHADLGLGEIGIYEGASVRPGPPPSDVSAPAAAALELRVVGGLDAGLRMPLRAGDTVTIGRDPGCELELSDPGVSRRHLSVSASSGGTVTVTDLDSANGTWLEGERLREPRQLAPGAIFEAGDVALAVVAPQPLVPLDPVREVRSDGTVAFNRPPRPRAPESFTPLELPETPLAAQKPQFSAVAIAGPLVLGAVMVIALHSITYALFMVLSPAMAVGQYVEQRRRSKHASLGQGRHYRQQIERFEQDLTTRRDEELTRRRITLPDPAELLRRVQTPDPTLWERRAGHADFLLLTGGFGRLPFVPLFEKGAREISGSAEAALQRVQRLPPAPVDIDLNKGGVVGIVGPREESLAVARALLCQATALHGPADLQVAILGEEATIDSWAFAKWLPHARDHFGGGSKRLIASGRLGAETLISSLRERREVDPRTVLAVVDSPSLIEGRGAPGRTLLREGPRVSGIILATSSERLPANCTTVIELSAGSAEARLNRPQRGESVDPVLVTGVTAATADRWARALAKFEDADLDLDGSSLPTDVELLPLLGLQELSATELSARWAQSRLDGRLTATIGMDRNGPFSMDLVRDGPHGLIAGTTGAGKSELLRSLVAALAVSYSPERLNFVLIDYKGGSAFARCAELPHTVGMVTDLDEQLGARALTSLEAELRHRERVLREHGADDIPGLDRLVAAGRAEPLPRLLVIIDEFATLASELPDFVASLVGIAQRGRSLGVHLILATQRPSGAVNENIRANTNIRISLRVQTSQDSQDVIDDRAAANISRVQPGRAYVRLGPADLDPIQTALVTGPAVSADLASVRARPFELIPADEGAHAAEGPSASDPTSLDLVVRAAREAYGDAAAPRRPWLEPLAPEIDLEQLLSTLHAQGEGGRALPFAGERGFTIPLALADDPAAQAQHVAGWNLDAGNLLMIGIGGSGTSTALTAIATCLAMTTDPDRMHIYAMDFGAGDLLGLAELPHVGAVTMAAEHERHIRLIRMLRAEMNERRQNGTAGKARIVVLLDGYAGFAAEHSDIAGDALRTEFGRLWADGAEVGIHLAVAGERPGAMPSSLVSLVQQRVIFQLADPAEYGQFGIRRAQLPRFAPGRSVLAVNPPMVLQIGRPRTTPAALAQALARPTAPVNPPPPVGVLPSTVALGDLLTQAGGSGPDPDALWLPVAIEDGQLGPAGWSLYPGDHVLISGPPRTGRTTALATLAAVSAARYPEVEIAVAAGNARSPLLNLPGLLGRASSAAELTELLGVLTEQADPQRPRLLLIDDADALEDPGRALAALIADRDSGVHVIAAGRSEGFRALGHWSIGMRASRNGLIIQPADPNMDGAPLNVAIPRRPSPPVRPGCGYLVVAGTLGLAQVAVAEMVSA